MAGKGNNVTDMDAVTLNCPMCGAPASSDATVCGHCGAQLATVACPSCFGLIFKGAKFCSHCGAKVDRVEMAEPDREPCPRCGVGMKAIDVGGTKLRECPKCEGIWVTTDTLKEICEDREKQSAVLGLAGPLPQEGSVDIESVHYIPCPICHELMNRVNFANCSHVVVNVCRQHGTWFDKDELRRIIEFIRAGGMDKARTREIQELEQKKRELSGAQTAGACPMDEPIRSYSGTDLEYDVLSSIAGSVIKHLFG
jgi:Zn-finger nucleic acid-binding protein